MTANSAYTTLTDRFARLHALEGALGVLHWDSAVILPPGGAEQRGKQLAVLEGILQREAIANDLPELLSDAEAIADRLNDWQAANLRRMRHRWAHRSAVPPELTEALTEAGSACEFVWREARKKGDYAAFLPHFRKVLSLMREKAAAKAEALKLSPYDALLDGFDPGNRMAHIAPVFAELEKKLPALIDAILSKQAKQFVADLPSVAEEKQRAVGLKVMTALGFDMTSGRLDVSTHPFCSGSAGDVRITTRYNPALPLSSLMGVCHETGHALYEQHLPKEWRGQPVGDALGMALHESQSLSVEMQLCRSLPFFRFVAPLMRDAFGGDASAWMPERLYARATRVERSLIRVEADEATYPMHILLRTRLEQELLSGALAPEDLPDAWDAGMERLLGIRPKNPGEGCMQDIHWTDGSFGYFPTYTLGALIAAQLFTAAKKAIPGWEAQVEKGVFTQLLGWFCTNVHEAASRYDRDELLTRATGEGLNPAFFLNHLQARYLDG